MKLKLSNYHLPETPTIQKWMLGVKAFSATMGTSAMIIGHAAIGGGIFIAGALADAVLKALPPQTPPK